MQVGQVLAGLLAAISTAAAAFLQFNRPYADWRLYREYQRCGERERFVYDNGLAPYNKPEPAENEQQLAERLLELQRRLGAQVGGAAARGRRRDAQRRDRAALSQPPAGAPCDGASGSQRPSMPTVPVTGLESAGSLSRV